MGTAYTGQGISHKFDKLIATATETVFLKCPPTNAISHVLNEAASDFIRRGYDVDKFMDPIHPDKTAAVFVKGPELLFLQASHPIALEPSDLGGKHKVISFYDVYDEQKLRDKNSFISKELTEAEIALEKALNALSDAKKIHDDWEAVNISRMLWEIHEQMIASLKVDLFGSIELNKASSVTHRLIGSLTSGGAHDFVPSITKRVDKRILIKGLPGTGKSTLMRAVGAEGEKRGFDVQYGWCGLDSTSVDLVIFPELSVCFLDATQPHAYDPERPGDEILDLVQMCSEDANAEKKIEDIHALYKEKMLDATGYLQAHAQADNRMTLAMDSAIKHEVFDTKANILKSYCE